MHILYGLCIIKLYKFILSNELFIYLLISSHRCINVKRLSCGDQVVASEEAIYAYTCVINGVDLKTLLLYII